MRSMSTTLVTLAVLGAAAPLAAQGADFQWSGNVAAGQLVEVHGVNGAIEAAPSPDGAVHVDAIREGNRSDPESVRIEVVEHAGGVAICAIYPTPRGESANECRPGGPRNQARDNDVKVEFRVRVPRDVEFSGHMVNGGIRATDLPAQVRAATVNGNVTIENSRIASARTVNGNLSLRVAPGGFDAATDIATVNGRITLELPANIGAELHASAVNGRIESDFPVTVTGRFGPRQARGTLGAGGPELRVQTVNGGIQLRRI